jgi:hypothetical protein
MYCRGTTTCRYNDFKKYADEDAAAEYMYGMECLFRFYSYGLENNFRVPLYKVRGSQEHCTKHETVRNHVPPHDIIRSLQHMSGGFAPVGYNPVLLPCSAGSTGQALGQDTLLLSTHT